MTISPGWTGRCQAAGLERLEAFRALPGECVKEEVATRVWIAELTGRAIYLKLYRDGLLSSWLTGVFRARAVREYDNLGRLRELHIPAALPVACAARWGPLGSCSLLVTEAVPAADNLAAWAHANPTIVGAPDHPVGEHVVAALARHLATAHRAGLFLVTPHLKNILVSPEADEPICFIDVPRARWLPGRAGDPQLRAKDLGVLLKRFGQFFSATLQDRFFEGYLTDSGLDGPTFRALAEECARREANETLLSGLVHRGKRLLKDTLGIHSRDHSIPASPYKLG